MKEAREDNHSEGKNDNEGNKCRENFPIFHIAVDRRIY